MADSVLFTVFTPTYNRAHTLHRVYDSLCAQTLRDFEWIVIDDGSTDSTGKLVSDWAKSADFSVRYLRQAHSGKHIAHNLAMREARGEFFLPLDSDDACTPRALERMAYHWNTIPANERLLYSGIDGLCSNQNGEIIGDRFPSEPFDTTLRERRYIYRISGEKWGSTLTDLVRRFPFPEIANSQFMPEGLVWFDMAKHYKTRCVNEVFRIYYVDDAQTGETLSNRTSFQDAPGRAHYYIWLLNNDLDYLFNRPAPFVKAAAMLPMVARLSGKSLRDTIRSLNRTPAKLLVLLALPISYFLYAFDYLLHVHTTKKPFA